MSRLAASILLSLLAVFCVLAPAGQGQGFPGKGNPGDWSDALPYYNLANRYLNQGRYDDAVEKYKQAIGMYQFDPDFYTNLGVAYRKLDDYQSAAEAFKRASALNPHDWVPMSDLANAYLKQDKLAETVATFEKTLKCNPPAQEKAHILQDIKDINKILKMQGGQTSPNNQSKPGTTISTKPATGKRTAQSNANANSIQQPQDPKALKGSGWDYVYK